VLSQSSPKRSLIVSAPAKKEKQSLYKYAWVLDTDVNSYNLTIPGLITQNICEFENEWHMNTHLGNKHFVGVRPTLEEAFKASDRLLYQHFPKEWTVTDARAIMASWREDLNL